MAVLVLAAQVLGHGEPGLQFGCCEYLNVYRNVYKTCLDAFY